MVKTSKRRLSFHNEMNKQLYSDYLTKMESHISSLLKEILDALSNSTHNYALKVVSQSKKPAIHIGQFNEGKWTVIAWIDPCLKWLNLRCPTGINLSDIWENTSTQRPSSSPHSVVMKRITENRIIPMVIKAVRRAENLQKKQRNL